MAAGTTRLAPSPTGVLHLGNARTFLINWLLAKQRGWAVRFRMEDLDGPRVKTEAGQQAFDVLAWMGLTWEGEVVYQSDRHEAYRQALDTLANAGGAYPCTCSRSDIANAASAPDASNPAAQGMAVYPGTCRNRFNSADQAHQHAGIKPAWRARVTEARIDFTDRFAGDQSFDLANTSGDFVIFRKQGLAAYQLAVVVDDAEAGVDCIVRGDDLLESAAMQIHLRRQLGLADHVEHWHVPLILGPDGRKLAKRHGDTRLTTYRDKGMTPEKLLGLLAYWCNAQPTRKEISLAALLEKFEIERIPKTPQAFTPEDHAFLLGL